MYSMNEDIPLSREIILRRIIRMINYSTLAYFIGLCAMLILGEAKTDAIRMGRPIIAPLAMLLISENCQRMDIGLMRAIVALTTCAEMFLMVGMMAVANDRNGHLPFSSRFAAIRIFAGIYRWWIAIQFIILNTACGSTIILCGRIPPVEMILWVAHAISLYMIPQIMQQINDINVLIA